MILLLQNKSIATPSNRSYSVNMRLGTRAARQRLHGRLLASSAWSRSLFAPPIRGRARHEVEQHVARRSSRAMCETPIRGSVRRTRHWPTGGAAIDRDQLDPAHVPALADMLKHAHPAVAR